MYAALGIWTGGCFGRGVEISEIVVPILLRSVVRIRGFSKADPKKKETEKEKGAGSFWGATGYGAC